LAVCYGYFDERPTSIGSMWAYFPEQFFKMLATLAMPFQRLHGCKPDDSADEMPLN
jgi:hypothetical protein